MINDEFVQLSEVFEVKNGYAFTSKEQEEQKKDKYIEILKQGHIQIGGGLRKNPKKFYVPISQKLEKYILEKGDIVLAMTDMKDNVVILGVPAIIDENNKYVINQRVGWLKPKKNVFTKFFYYQMLTKDFLEDLRAKANSGVQVNLTSNAIREMPLWNPPIDIKTGIVEVLSSLDDKIDLLHEQNKTLEEMAEILFRQWLENVEVHESTIVLTIEDVATVQNGYSFKSSEFITEGPDTIEVLKMGHISADGGLRPSPKKDFVKRCEKFEKWILNKRDIILAMTDMKDNVVILGVPALIDQDNKYVLNQRVGRIFLKENSAIDSILILYMQMKEKNFISELQSKGNSGVQVNLGTDTIRQTKIVVPVKEFQKEILPQLESIFDKLDQNSKHIQKLETLRDTLLPKLMSGLVIVNKIA